LKAHNPAQNSINNDIEKLVCEEETGNWFHTFKNIDSRTLPVLFDKFKISFDKLKNKNKDITITHPIVFCFCVIDLKLAIMKVFDPKGMDINLYVDEFFRINYTVRQGKFIIKDEDKNGWEIVGDIGVY
jgi:hypothetical protein